MMTESVIPYSPSLVRQCRDCGIALPDYTRSLCDICKARADERQRERRRARARMRYVPVISTDKKKPPVKRHHCATQGCKMMVKGKRVYCEKCRRIRQAQFQREYRCAQYVDPLPFGPPTSMDWLKGFDAWAKSGMSYGEFQATERSNSE